MTGAEAITGIDHLLVGVRDLEAARRTWEKLGFTMTPRGRHIGWGTANYCAMFARDYIELLGILDPKQFTNNLDRFLEHGEGLMGLAFATSDAEAAARVLRQHGFEIEGPSDLARLLELPDGDVKPAFRVAHLAASATPGIPAFICQHLTPELVWQKPWLKHPNGALRIVAMTAVVAAPDNSARAYGELFGDQRITIDEGAVSVDTGGALIRLVTAERLRREQPGAVPQPEARAPWLAAMRLAVAERAATAAYLAGAAVPYHQDSQGILRIDPRETCGVLLELAES